MIRSLSLAAVVLLICACATTRSTAERTGPFLSGTKGALAVTVYIDYECQYSAQAILMLTKLKKGFGDQITISLRQTPMGFHPNSRAAALAALAAESQGLLWNMTTGLFEAQANLTPQKIRLIATKTPLDMNQFDKELQSKRLGVRLEQHIKEANQRNVFSTPVFVIGQERVRGAQPYENVRSAVTRALAFKNKSQPLGK